MFFDKVLTNKNCFLQDGSSIRNLSPIFYAINFPPIFTLVKILSLIFSCYLLLLSCLPCGDTDECKQDDASQQTAATSDHSRHDDDTENCAPFCSCACCAVAVYFPQVASIQIYSLFLPPVKFQFSKTAFLSHHSNAVWQPPRLA